VAIAMTRIGKVVDTALGMISLLGGALLALAGFGMTMFGLYGFIVGVHGGPTIATLWSIFGAGLAFIGYLGIREGFHTIRSKNKKSAKSI
jgi:hypothetical protein